jgi:hypothetical protein
LSFRQICEADTLRRSGALSAVVIYTLIRTAKLNDLDPQARLADVLARIGIQCFGQDRPRLR